MLTYGGIPLLLPDSDGELQTWMRQNQDIADAVLQGDTTLADISPRRGLLAWGGVRKGIGQTIANYAAAPPPRINSLYWPTGATRWARGYFLCTGKNKNKITALAHSAGGNTPLVLKWGDQDVRTPLTASMYLLPPRPISRVAAPYNSTEEQLWLLPLVDERYWWQFKATANLKITPSMSWSDLISAIGISATIPTAIDAAYLNPDPYEFTRRYENAAMMLDAVALSVGKRVVRRCDGTVRLESNADAQTVVTANSAIPAALMAGGYYHLEAGYRPAKVICTFRKWRYYALLALGDVYSVEVTPDIDTAVTQGTTKVIHSTAHADYSDSDSSPENSSELDSLSSQISRDFYGWLRSRYDLTLAGAHPWELNGFDDSVIWDFGRQVVGGAADGARLGQTRVQSMPENFGFDLQGSQNHDLFILEPHAIGITRLEYTQGGVAEFLELDVYVWLEGKFKKIPGVVIKARDWFLNKDEVLEKNTKVKFEWHYTTWIVTGMYCSPTDLDEFQSSPGTGSPGEMEGGGGGSPSGGGDYGGGSGSNSTPLFENELLDMWSFPSGSY